MNGRKYIGSQEAMHLLSKPMFWRLPSVRVYAVAIQMSSGYGSELISASRSSSTAPSSSHPTSSRYAPPAASAAATAPARA